MGDQPERRRATLADVAALAGVSQATVSRSLADDPRITKETRKSVWAAAEQLRYVPNAAARSLRVSKTRTLGLLLADLSDPVHGQVASGFESAAGKHGYTVIFVAGYNDPTQERRALEVFREQGTEGVALLSSVLDPDEALESTRQNRLVFVQPEHESIARGGLDMPGVIQVDDAGGIETAVLHLLERGRRDIMYLGAGAAASNTVRRDTTRRVAEAAGQVRFRVLQVGNDGWRTPAAVGSLVAARPPDAVVCYDDKLALALMDGLRASGLVVPDDVAVVGFDGIPFAALARPRLTTVAAPTSHLGELAARGLVDAIRTGSLPSHQILPVELIVRESTGERPAAKRRRRSIGPASGRGGRVRRACTSG